LRRAVLYFNRGRSALVRARPELRGRVELIICGDVDPIGLISAGVVVIPIAQVSIGEALNLAISSAGGRALFRQDDDDWYSPRWLSGALAALERSRGGLCGLPQFLAYDVTRRAGFWAQKDPAATHCAGGTLGFWRETWDAAPFLPVSSGEDRAFVEAAVSRTGWRPEPSGTVADYVYIRHRGNTIAQWGASGTAAESSLARATLGADLAWYDAIGRASPRPA
jgi:hypothetical protein